MLIQHEMRRSTGTSPIRRSQITRHPTYSTLTYAKAQVSDHSHFPLSTWSLPFNPVRRSRPRFSPTPSSFSRSPKVVPLTVHFQIQARRFSSLLQTAQTPIPSSYGNATGARPRYETVFLRSSFFFLRSAHFFVRRMCGHVFAQPRDTKRIQKLELSRSSESQHFQNDPRVGQHIEPARMIARLIWDTPFFVVQGRLSLSLGVIWNNVCTAK